MSVRSQGPGTGGSWPRIAIVDPYNAGLALARRMTRMGARVTVLESEPIVGRSRGVEGVTAFPRPGEQSWLEVLQRIADKDRECVVLTGTDRGSAWLVENSPMLPPQVRAFERGSEAHMALMDKRRADTIARAAGVAVPWTGRVASAAQLEQVLTGAPWPCVVKPAFSHEWRERYGAVRAFLAEGPEEALRVLERPVGDGMEMLLSQYIPGGDDHVEEAIVVRLADGSYPVRFGCRKLRQYPIGFGETAFGESSPLPETMALAQRVLDAASFVGVAGVEAKRHADTGERWFLEVNVRLPGQWGLGDACGVQASPRLVTLLAGGEVGPSPPLRTGVRLVQPDLDRHVVLAQLRAAPRRERAATALRLARSYAGARELGLADPRDPGPALAQARLFAGRRLDRLKAKWRT